VVQIERDALHPAQWQLRLEGSDGGLQVAGGFDRVVLAMPHPQAHDLLLASGLAPNCARP
jgi:renalase